MSGLSQVSATQHSSVHTVLLSPNVCLLPLQETSTLLSNAFFLSLSPFSPFISCLHQHKECLHLIPGLLGTLLDFEIFTARLGGNLLPFKLFWLVMVNSLLSILNTGIPFED